MEVTRILKLDTRYKWVGQLHTPVALSPANESPLFIDIMLDGIQIRSGQRGEEIITAFPSFGNLFVYVPKLFSLNYFLNYHEKLRT